MTYEEWLATVPPEFTGDPLWRIEVYRLAFFAGNLPWHDASRLVQDKRAIGLANQSFRAAGSVTANVAEGYSRRSGKDQARFYEYALGSAREGRTWYHQARHILTETVAQHRVKLLTGIVRLLLTIIPTRRGAKIEERRAAYDPGVSAMLDDPPLP